MSCCNEKCPECLNRKTQTESCYGDSILQVGTVPKPADARGGVFYRDFNDKLWFLSSDGTKMISLN